MSNLIATRRPASRRLSRQQAPSRAFLDGVSAAGLPGRPDDEPPVGDADLAALPAAAQRYLRLHGNRGPPSRLVVPRPLHRPVPATPGRAVDDVRRMAIQRPARRRAAVPNAYPARPGADDRLGHLPYG